MHQVFEVLYAAGQAVSDEKRSPMADLGSVSWRCAALCLDSMHFMWCLSIQQQGVNTGEGTSSQWDSLRFGPGMSAGE